MRILGIDPGTARIGWAVIERNTSSPGVLAYGCITTNKHKSAEDRLSSVYHDVQKLIKRFAPTDMAMENLFFTTNAKTVIPVAEARGVILLAASQKHIPVSSYSPVTIKSAIAGYGRADKTQVTRMIMRTLNLKTKPTPDDTADALAVALTHAYSLKKHFNV